MNTKVFFQVHLLIIFVFDPLAVLLIIAANMSINQVRNKPKKLVDAVDASKDFEPMQAEVEEVEEEVIETRTAQLANSTIVATNTFHGIKKDGKWARNERGVDLKSKIGDNENN